MDSLSFRTAASPRASYATEIKKERRGKVEVASMTSDLKRPKL
jgi:hypothetical protein